jgi:hypothetical protein
VKQNREEKGRLTEETTSQGKGQHDFLPELSS